jgi:hypothetical protein
MKKIVCVVLGLLVAFFLSNVSTAQELELIFSHKYHAIEVEAECEACHAASASMLSTDNLLPDMEKCYTCHSQDEECSKCHKDPDNAIVYPRITDYIAKFPHSTHAAKGLACEKCHAGVAESDNILEKHLPTMASCTDCHDQLARENYCYTCHNTGEALKPGDHNLAWNKEHGLASYTADNSCKTCHPDDMCLNCHRGDNLDHQVHSLNFVNNHSLQAKGNKENCYTCHEELSFCVDCHRQRMVMPRNHATASWSNTSSGGGHARAAKLDMDSCLSCHSDAAGDPVCVQCHQK